MSAEGAAGPGPGSDSGHHLPLFRSHSSSGLPALARGGPGDRARRGQPVGWQQVQCGVGVQACPGLEGLVHGLERGVVVRDRPAREVALLLISVSLLPATRQSDEAPKSTDARQEATERP